MKQQSEDEEGFIPSGFQIKKKAHHTAHHHAHNHNYLANTYYRYSGYFIKKEHPLSLITPLTLTHQTAIQPSVVARPKIKSQSEHPYKMYCCSSEFYLIYNKHSDQPFICESEFIKNQVSLYNIEDRHSPSLKEIKTFQEQLPEKLIKEDDLIFDSKFQSGNLHCAFRRKETNEYHFFIENDTNTLGYNQWFYFSVRNMRKNIKYLFYIVNYRKRLNFFEEGQRIVMFSRNDAEEHKNGWRRAGNNYCLQLSAFSSSLQKQFYTLSFSLQFAYNNDYVALASSLPYSYSKLLQELRSIQNEARKNQSIKINIETIATSICNNQLPQVTITNTNFDTKDRHKKMVIVIARQHPGQIWSSYKAEGFIRAFLKDTPQIKYILQNYIVKVIPMINVDGVIYGNFRCDVTGVDLNRRWKLPSKFFHPHIFEIKQKIINYNKKWKIELFIDLHGHSKKYNIFCYSCKHNSYTCRILPYLIEKQSQIFHMPSCTFGLNKDKQSTARATISKILKLENVLTLETSTFGWISSTKPKHFNPLDLYKFMQNLCVALSYFLDKQSVSYREANKEIHKKISQFHRYDEQNQQQSGSQSEPEEDQIDFQTKLSTIFDIKYKNEFKCFQTMPQDENDQIINEHSIAIQLEQQKMIQNIPKIADKQKQIKIIANKQEKLLTKTILPTNKKSINLDSIRQISRKSGRSEVYPSQKQRDKNVKTASKNFFSREKRRLSLNVDQKSHLQISSLNPPSIKQNPNKNIIQNSVSSIQHKQLSPIQKKKQKSSKFFLNQREKTKQINQLRQEGQLQQRQEKKNENTGFFQRFQRYVAFGASTGKKNSRLNLLQQGLENDDTTFQLNLMFQNKRKLQLRELQKNRQYSFIETSTKRQFKKQPFSIFSRLKHTQRLKQKMRILYQQSDRESQSEF